MLASFLLSSSLVPVLGVWMLGRARAHRLHRTDWVDGLRSRLAGLLNRVAPGRLALVAGYFVVAVGLVTLIAPVLGREIFPPSSTSTFQLRFRAPAGTKFEVTEQLGRVVLDEIASAAGPGNVSVTLGYIGVQPRRIPSTRSSCGRADRTKACSRWRYAQTLSCDSNHSRKGCDDGSARSSPTRRSRSSPATS
jgi:multidrug efflux pump subunit AcrB